MNHISFSQMAVLEKVGIFKCPICMNFVPFPLPGGRSLNLSGAVVLET